MKLILAIILFLFFLTTANAESKPWHISLEGGAALQTVNDVAIPSDTGTRFSLIDAVGKGPFPYYRIEATYDIKEKHRLRLLIAPLAIEKTGQLDKQVVFDGKTFTAGTNTKFRYQFNSYRLTYAYRIYQSPAWRWHMGFTAKIREAEIALTQSNVSSSYPNLGFVPLLYVSAKHQINSQWYTQMDLDAIASPYGRAIDLGLFALHKINDNWNIGAGYRTIEGGADNDKVYTFAWLHYVGLKLSYTK